MNLKIIHRTSTVWNILGFVLLTLFFFFVEKAIFNNQTALDIVAFKEFLRDQKYLLVGTFITFGSIYFYKKMSKYFYIALVGWISLMVGIDIYTIFDKLLISLLFIFILIAYYFYIVLCLELDKACFNTNVDKNELFAPMLYEISCQIKSEMKLDESSELYLLNWDKSSCFIASKWKDLPKNKKVEFTVEYKERKFSQFARIVSFRKGIGFGVIFLKEKPDEKKDLKLSWNELYEIMSDLGLDVRYLK